MFVNTSERELVMGLRRQQDRHQREGRISNESLDLKMKAITRTRINIGFSGTHFYMSLSYFVKKRMKKRKSVPGGLDWTNLFKRLKRVGEGIK